MRQWVTESTCAVVPSWFKPADPVCAAPPLECFVLHWQYAPHIWHSIPTHQWHSFPSLCTCHLCLNWYISLPLFLECMCLSLFDVASERLTLQPGQFNRDVYKQSVRRSKDFFRLSSLWLTCAVHVLETLFIWIHETLLDVYVSVPVLFLVSVVVVASVPVHVRDVTAGAPSSAFASISSRHWDANIDGLMVWWQI